MFLNKSNGGYILVIAFIILFAAVANTGIV